MRKTVTKPNLYAEEIAREQWRLRLLEKLGELEQFVIWRGRDHSDYADDMAKIAARIHRLL
jgi:hypothetical protein